MFRTKTAIAVTVLACVFAPAVFAQKLPIENIQLRGDRFRGLSYGEMTPEQRTFLDHTVNSARAANGNNTTANGPFNVLMRSPEIGDLSQALGNAIRFSSGLNGRVRELATLMAGRAWTSRYEWYAHARYAKQEKVADDVIAAIAAHRTPDLKRMPADEAIAWRVTDEMLYTRQITDATYQEALATLGERELMSTVIIAAYYEYISMILNVDRYPLPSDAAKGADKALAPLSPRSRAHSTSPCAAARGAARHTPRTPLAVSATAGLPPPPARRVQRMSSPGIRSMTRRRRCCSASRAAPGSPAPPACTRPRRGPCPSRDRRRWSVRCSASHARRSRRILPP